MKKDISKIQTLGELKAADYQSTSIKEEMRKNLKEKIRNRENVFEGILGFDDTVIPDLERAILSRHNILLLGLRGQAKTRIARLMVNLLDDYIPIIAGSEINDDPLEPISLYGKTTIAEHGDDTPITWVPRGERYVEKLATPDVSIADLIGDIDPIKAATLKLPYSDERVLHFGLVPRSNRSIFVMNELPDLQARIQVSLFNILQERDIQIRGFKLRMPLDLHFVFTANPEDYTNRGSIITPLKDRIESQILTHYPTSIFVSRDITQQEARIHKEQASILVPEMHRDLIEMIAFEARENEFIDEKSGVSARLSISALENLVSAAERRSLKNGDEHTHTRLSDFWGIIPAITGKVELLYEGEQEGPYGVALDLISRGIKESFLAYFDEPDKYEEGVERDPYGTIKAWFSTGNSINLLTDDSDEIYREKLDSVAGLAKLVESDDDIEGDQEKYAFMELILHGLAEMEVISKEFLENSIKFDDPLGDIFDPF